MTEKEFIEKMYHEYLHDDNLQVMSTRNDKACFWDIQTDKHEIYPVTISNIFFCGYELVPDIKLAKAYASFRGIEIPNFNNVTFKDIKIGECFIMLGSKFKKIDDDRYVNVERIKVMDDKNKIVEKC